jgi:hypothetical protein
MNPRIKETHIVIEAAAGWKVNVESLVASRVVVVNFGSLSNQFNSSIRIEFDDDQMMVSFLTELETQVCNARSQFIEHLANKKKEGR